MRRTRNLNTMLKRTFIPRELSFSHKDTIVIRRLQCDIQIEGCSKSTWAGEDTKHPGSPVGLPGGGDK